MAPSSAQSLLPDSRFGSSVFRIQFTNHVNYSLFFFFFSPRFLICRIKCLELAPEGLSSDSWSQPLCSFGILLFSSHELSISISLSGRFCKSVSAPLVCATDAVVLLLGLASDFWLWLSPPYSGPHFLRC